MTRCSVFVSLVLTLELSRASRTRRLNLNDFHDLSQKHKSKSSRPLGWLLQGWSNQASELATGSQVPPSHQPNSDPVAADPLTVEETIDRELASDLRVPLSHQPESDPMAVGQPTMAEPLELHSPDPAHDDCDTSDWKCSEEHNWIAKSRNTNGLINTGGYGQVWAVRLAASKDPRELFDFPWAIKFPVSMKSSTSEIHLGQCRDIRNEAHKLAQIESDVGRVSRCHNFIMHVKDEYPCTSMFSGTRDYLPIPGFVMEKMDGDLDDWWDIALRKEMIDTCKGTVASMVYDALKCLHDGDWVHADFKFANILFQGIKGCPSKIRLADYGMSGKIGQKSRKLFEHWQYLDNENLPQDMFHMPHDDGKPHTYPLGLARPEENHYVFGPELDWCAFHYAWYAKFGERVEVRPGDWKGNCGPMGNRKENVTDFYVQ